MESLHDSYLLAIFQDHSRVPDAIDELILAGFDEGHIGLAVREGCLPFLANELATELLTVPGIGRIKGAGLLASCGGQAGRLGMADALVQIGIPEEEARLVEEELSLGHAVILVQTDSRYSEALAILGENGPQDVVREVAICAELKPGLQ